MSLIFTYKGIDSFFTAIRILTMLTFLAWPLIAFLTIMAFGKGSYGLKALCIVALCYPVLFMFVVHVAEKYVSSFSYPLSVALALIPILIAAVAVYWFQFRKPQFESYKVIIEGKSLSIGYGLRTGAKGPEHEPIPVILIPEVITEEYVLSDREKMGFPVSAYEQMPNILNIKTQKYSWGTYYTWQTPTYGAAVYHYVQRKNDDYSFRIGPVQGTRNMEVHFYWDLVE